MIRTDYDYVAGNIKPTMRVAERPEVVCLRIPAAIWQSNRLAAELTFVVVQELQGTREPSIAYNPS